MNIFLNKYSTMRRLVHFTILLLFFSTGALAQARYWVAPGASGNFSDAANWSLSSGGAGGAGAPTTTQTAIFDGGSSANCQLNIAGTLTLSSLQTTAAYAGTIAPSTTTTINAGTFTIAGGSFVSPTNLNASNIFRLNGGSFTAGAGTTNFNNAVHVAGGTFNAAGTMTFERNLDVATSTAVFNPGTSTAVFSGNTSVFVGIDGAAIGTLNFYNLEINKVPPAVNFAIAAGDQLNVLNDFTLTDGFFRGPNASLNIGGNFTTGPNSDAILSQVTLNGANNSVVNINAPVVNQAGASFTINKAPGAEVNIVTNLASNTVNISSYAPAILNIQSGAVSFPDNDNVIMNFAAFNIGANASVVASSGTTTFHGSFANSGTFTANNGTVIFESAVNRHYSVGSPAVNSTTTFYNLILNNTGADGRFDLEMGDRLNVQNDLTVQNGYFGVPGGSLTNQSFLGVGGNLVLNATAKPFTNAIHLQFIGDNAQSVTLNGNTTGHINGNVSFAKTDIGPITLNSPMILDVAGQTVNFIGGVLETSITNILNFAVNGVNATGGNSGSYIEGPVERTGNTAFTFPTGNNSYYGPIHISGATFNAAFTTASYRAQYFHVNPDGSYPIDQQSPTNPPDLKISEVEYWILDQISPAPATGPRVWLSYESGRSGGVGDPSTIGVTGWTNPGFWQLVGNGGLVNVGGIDYVASAALNNNTVSQGSPIFTLSTIDEIANPLPVTWLSFTGRFYSGSVDLNWSTSMELNNEAYTIERSAEGHQYTTIGSVDGVGNTTNISRYNFKDTNPLSGTSYYRIKQTDRDGKFSYSDVIRVTNGDLALKGLRIFPNPNSGKLPLTLENGTWTNKKVTVTIYNAVGGIVRQEQVTFGADSRAKINVDALQKGSYFITTSINSERLTLQFFIQ